MPAQEKEWYLENSSNLGAINLTLIDLPTKIKRKKLNFPLYDIYSAKNEFFGNYMYPTKFNGNSKQYLYKYIPINQNADVWVEQNLKNISWEEGNFFTSDDNVFQENNIVILQDPIKRWCFGISRYLSKYHWDFCADIFYDYNKFNDDYLSDWISNNNIIAQIIFDKISFDLSTEKQVHFLHGVDPETTTFFYLNNNFQKSFEKFFTNELTLLHNFTELTHDTVSNTNNIIWIPSTELFDKLIAENLDQKTSELHFTDVELFILKFYKILRNYLSKNFFIKKRLEKYFEKDYELINSVTFYK